jgi:hypothetical protein
MNIKELLSEEQTKEAIVPALAAGARGLAKVGTKGLAAGARGLAKGTGAALGGLAGMGSAFKQGYTGGKLAVAGGPTTGDAGSDSNSIRQQIAQKKSEIVQLQQQLGTPKVEPGIGQQQGKVAAVAGNTPEPGATAPAKPVASAPPVEPGIGQQQGNVAAVAGNTPDPAQQSPEEIRKQKQAAATQVARDQMAANPAPTAPAPTVAPTAPAAPNPKAQQAALKARLQGQRAAGKSMATQTGGGFNQYVRGGGGQKLAGADAQGNPVFKQNVQRESVGYSKFLGCYI